MRNDGAGNIKGSLGGVFVAGWYCYLLLLAAVMTYLLITMGGIVCVTGGSSGCPDWPGCYGQPVPPMRIDSLIEYSHRLIAALTSPFIIAAAVVGLWRYRSIRWVSWPPALAIVLLIAVVIFGALVVLRGLPPGLAAVDLGSALMVLALMLTATVVAFARHADPTLPDRLSFHGSFARLTLWTLFVVFIVLVSGVLVARSGSLVRCLGWPLFSGRLVPADAHDWLETARLFIAGLATILLIAVIVQAWRLRPRHGTIRRTAMAVGILFLVELLVGMLMLARGYSVLPLVVFVAAAAALWALLVVLAVLAGLPPATLPDERNTTV